MASNPQTVNTKQISFERERGVYRIDVLPDMAHIVAKTGGDATRVEKTRFLLRLLADASVPIFLVKLHHTAVTFALEGKYLPAAEACLSAEGFFVTSRRDLALVSIVATSMRDLNGVMVRIADSFQEAGAHLYGVGDSHNSVQCLIDAVSVPEARTQLALAFGLD